MNKIVEWLTVGLVLTIVMLPFVVGMIFLNSWLDKHRPPSEDENCKRFYGKEYTYIYGVRSPDICVTIDGKVRYYNLIK